MLVILTACDWTQNFYTHILFNRVIGKISRDDKRIHGRPKKKIVCNVRKGANNKKLTKGLFRYTLTHLLSYMR